LENLWRRLVMPKGMGTSSLTSLQATVGEDRRTAIKRARYYWLLLAESYLKRRLFESILRQTIRLCGLGG
jgi:hypothetical protein